ncbi:glycoside hydrolase family 15 [Cellulomonas sp. NPDC089187]|uniref:glycoside hydrolase family 15 n=1 Tax=Cellulomonas sp. NPDC089187 TaxID=3154970 RepID=UPI0034363C1B
MSVALTRRSRRVISVLVLSALAATLIAWGATGPRSARIGLYSEAVVLGADGTPTLVPEDGEPVLHAGTRVMDDPVSTADDTLAAEQRAWLADGQIPGADGPYVDMVTDALLDLRTLVRDDGAAVAAWSPYWRYVWPRDSSFVAVALAHSGHHADAVAILDFLAQVQEADGSFEARYLPDGTGDTPDDRGEQTDGTGWVLWAANEVVQTAADPVATAEHLRPLVQRTAHHAERLVIGDGLPEPSPDYWEVPETQLTLGTVAPVLAGLENAAEFWTVLGETERSASAQAAADLSREAVESEFDDYGRYAGGDLADAASAFTLPPFQPVALDGALKAWQDSADRMARPAGGLAPGEGWRRDGISWTPQTSLYAYTAASNGQDQQATAWLDWLDAHRTDLGALPEKVLDDGSPAAVAPLAWTAACVVLAVDALEG